MGATSTTLSLVGAMRNADLHALEEYRCGREEIFELGLSDLLDQILRYRKKFQNACEMERLENVKTQYLEETSLWLGMASLHSV